MCVCVYVCVCVCVCVYVCMRLLRLELAHVLYSLCVQIFYLLCFRLLCVPVLVIFSAHQGLVCSGRRLCWLVSGDSMAHAG